MIELKTIVQIGLDIIGADGLCGEEQCTCLGDQLLECNSEECVHCVAALKIDCDKCDHIDDVCHFDGCTKKMKPVVEFSEIVKIAIESMK